MDDYRWNERRIGWMIHVGDYGWRLIAAWWENGRGMEVRKFDRHEDEKGREGSGGSVEDDWGWLTLKLHLLYFRCYFILCKLSKLRENQTSLTHLIQGNWFIKHYPFIWLISTPRLAVSASQVEVVSSILSTQLLSLMISAAATCHGC